MFDKKNPRRSTLELTTSGRALLAQVATEYEGLLVPHIKRFGQPRLDALMAELRALTITLYAPLDLDD
jgi:DNA-binding MarR family transcriptional regulator